MKYATRNTDGIQTEKQSVFSEKVMVKIRMKLQQFAEIEYLYHKKKTSKKK